MIMTMMMGIRRYPPDVQTTESRHSAEVVPFCYPLPSPFRLLPMFTSPRSWTKPFEHRYF
jgi:hypothetical protein